MSRPLRSTLLLATLFTTSLCYTWPSPKLDALESARFDQTGWRSLSLANGVVPCSAFTHPTGSTDGIRSNAGDWIRTAYHDMATHNVEDGTGGLDGSIRFAAEQARSENAGDGFHNTIDFLQRAVSRHLSVADLIALLATFAIENCGGPEISFRGGRIDATKPNNPGVPEPQQDLQSHISNFARQGFEQDEMIALVACGHTFGTVQHSAFPDIVPPNPSDSTAEAGASFDSSFTHFDNNVATEYIAGTTQNPLVAGANDTTNSDKRIFSSDGNITMAAFARSPELFASTCADLFGRMLNTVPAGVELSEVLQPLPVKPQDVKLTYYSNGTIGLSGEVRLWNVPTNDERVVKLIWTGKNGESCGGADCIVTLPHTTWQVGSAMSNKYQSVWYGTSSSSLATIDPARGIRKFWFEIQENKDGVVRKEDQGGKGFVLPTDEIMISSTSCGLSTATPRIHVAVHASTHPSRIFLEVQTPFNQTDVANSNRVVELAPAPELSSANESFVIWSTTRVQDVPQYLFDIVAEVGGARVELPYSEDGFSLLCL